MKKLIILIFILSCDDPPVGGCTSPSACNFDHEASVDDGSCEYCSCQACSDNATCSNTDGSFTCACNSGWEGDGTGCTDIIECLTDNGGCGDATYYTCTNNAGAAPTCACLTDTDGDGVCDE